MVFLWFSYGFYHQTRCSQDLPGAPNARLDWANSSVFLRTSDDRADRLSHGLDNLWIVYGSGWWYTKTPLNLEMVYNIWKSMNNIWIIYGESMDLVGG